MVLSAHGAHSAKPPAPGPLRGQSQYPAAGGFPRTGAPKAYGGALLPPSSRLEACREGLGGVQGDRFREHYRSCLEQVEGEEGELRCPSWCATGVRWHRGICWREGCPLAQLVFSEARARQVPMQCRG